MNQDLITYEDASQLLGVVYQTVRTMVTRGTLHSVKVPGKKTKYLHRDEVMRVHQGLPSDTSSGEIPTSAETSVPSADDTTARLAIADKVVRVYAAANEGLQDAFTHIAASLASASNAMAASMRDATLALIQGQPQDREAQAFYDVLAQALTGPDGKPSPERAGDVMTRLASQMAGTAGRSERDLGDDIAHVLRRYDDRHVASIPA